MNYDIISLGSITTDIFVRPSQLPTVEKDGREYFAVEVGEKIKLDDVFRSGGGSAGNSAVGFHNLGFKACPIGVIGSDEEGEHIQHKFERMGIETKYLVEEPDSSSSISFVLNAYNGRRTVLHHRTTSKSFNSEVLVDAPEAKGMYVGHLYPDSEEILMTLPSWKEKHEAFLAWNPGKTQFKRGMAPYVDLMEHIDVLILNVEEAEQFTDLTAPHIDMKDVTAEVIGERVGAFEAVETSYIHDVRALAKVFLDHGVQEVIITDGQRGAQGFGSDGTHVFVPTKKDICVSTLGAGDAFAVGVVSAKYLQKPLSEQVLWGSECATNVVKEFGAQHGYKSREEVEAVVSTL